MNPVKIFLAFVLCIVALYNFDIYNLDRCIVALLLLMQAVMLVSRNRKLNDLMRNVSVFLAIFLIFKILLGA